MPKQHGSSSATSRKRKRPRHQLPNEIVIFENKDKKFHESWTPGRSAASFPHPFRALLVGPPNVGKSNLIKNILMHADPPFEQAYLIYPGEGDIKEKTDEYIDVEGIEGLDDIPAPSFFKKAGDSKSKKTLIIIDDYCLKGLNKTQKSNLDRLFGTVSTHRNVSIMCTSQDWFSIPPVIRRMSNVWIVYKHRDRNSMTMISRKCSEDLQTLFRELAPGGYDSICIDNTHGSPYPLRLNLFTKIFKSSE